MSIGSRRPLGDERGIAMVTVLAVGAALTAVTSMAAFVTIQEFRAGRDDRKASEALAYAEAGIDRFMAAIRSNTFNYGQLRTAGCGKPPLTLPQASIGSGSFTANLVVYNPNATGAARFPSADNNPNSSACLSVPRNPSLAKAYFVITSTGTHPDARRVIRQVILVQPFLPKGIYANSVSATGSRTLRNISVISETDILGREKLTFEGDDLNYTLGDFFSSSGVSGRSLTEAVPAAAHSVGGIYMKPNGSQPEFTGPPNGTKNCAANGNPGNSQSLWDSAGMAGTGTITSGCVGQTGYPLSSTFTANDMNRVRPRKLDEQDHQTLKTTAQSRGLYCAMGTASSCTLMGGEPFQPPENWLGSDLTPLFTAGINSFVAYFEYTNGAPPETNSVRWKATVDTDPCPADPDALRSVMLVVRGGGLEMSGNAVVRGLIHLDGDFSYTGGATVKGTVVARSLNLDGGADFQMDTCWVENQYTAFDVTPVHWSEVDR